MNKVYQYKAVNTDGNLVIGQLTATDDDQVTDILWQQNLIAVQVHLAKLASIKRAADFFFKSFPSLCLGSVTNKSVLEITQHLSTLLSAGLPLITSMQVLARESRQKRIQNMCEGIVNDVQLGESLSAAMAKYPSYFNKQYRQLVAVGELTGKLPKVFQTLTDYLKSEVKTKSKVTNALIYPAAVIFVSFLIIAVLLLKVIPNFQSLFANFNKDLPQLTLTVIELSAWFRDNIVLLLLSFSGVYVVYRLSLYWSNIKRLRDGLILRVPVLGKLMTKAILARLSHTASLLLVAGIPIHQALVRLRESVDNSAYTEALLQVEKDVISGRALHESLKDTSRFPELFCQLAAVGEETGELDTCMHQLSDIYHQELEYAIERLISLIEPSIMVILGVTIGGLILVMYLPLFELSSLS